MSYCNKNERYALLASANGGKGVMQELLAAELDRHAVIDAEAWLASFKAELTAGKKHSSATLLRRKLKGEPARGPQ